MGLFSEYKKTLKLVETEEPIDLFINRPLGFLFMKLVYNTSLTPNHISTFSGILGAIAGIFFAHKNPSIHIAGVIILFLGMVLDCADGQLARAKKNGTKFGHVIDAFYDYITSIFVYGGMAIYLWTTGYKTVIFSFTISGWMWFALMMVAGFSTMLHSLLVDGAKNVFTAIVNKTDSNYFKIKYEEYSKGLEEVKSRGKGFFTRLPYTTYLNYLDIQIKSLNYQSEIDAEKFRKKNRIIMLLWMLIGPTNHLVAAIVCVLFNRYDLFIWLLIVPFNILTLILWIAQKIVNGEKKAIEK